MINLIRTKFHPLFHLRKIPLFREFQKRFDPDWRCRMWGVSVSLKLIRDASVWLGNNSEDTCLETLGQIIENHKIEVFFDIGANVGTYSWYALKAGVTEVFMVEADPVNQRLLSKTIRRNRLANCFLLPFAMGDKVDVREFLLDGASGSTGSLVDDRGNEHSLHNAYELDRKTKVLLLNLDVFSEYVEGKRVLLKIDVEGAEDMVFEGALSFLPNNKPFIQVECFEPSRLDRLKEGFGYSVKEMEENFNYLLIPPGVDV